VFFFVLLPFFLFQFHFCCHCVSPIPFPLLLTNFFSFFFLPLFLCFLLFPIGSFSALPLLLRHFSSCPSLLQYSTKRLQPPSVSQCYWIDQCSHLLPLLDFLLFFSPHYYVPWSPGLHMVILPWSSTGLWYLPPPLFLFYVAITTCTDVYLFVLCSSLLNYFLSHFVPALFSTIGSWCILALPLLLLPCNSAGQWLSPSYCLILDYLFINHILTLFPFLSSHFAHVSVLLCLAITPIKFYLSQSISLSKAALTITLPSTPNTCLNPAGWHHTTETLYTAYTLPYKNSVLEQQAFF